MANYKVDTVVVRETIKKLNSLKQDYETYREKKLPESKMSKGNVQNELEEIAVSINRTWIELYYLVDRTILFLTKSSDNIDKFDNDSANTLK